MFRTYWFSLSTITIMLICHWLSYPQIGIMPIGHDTYQPSNISIIIPIGHHVYKPLSLSAIMSITNRTSQAIIYHTSEFQGFKTSIQAFQLYWRLLSLFSACFKKVKYQAKFDESNYFNVLSQKFYNHQCNVSSCVSQSAKSPFIFHSPSFIS